MAGVQSVVHFSTFSSRYTRRVLAELATPTVCALAWSGLYYYQRSSLLEMISGFAVAFFFVGAIQGQLFRIAKNVRDEIRGEIFEDRLGVIEQGVERGFDDLQQGLQALRERGLATAQPEETPPFRPRPQGPTEVEQMLEKVNQPGLSSEDQFESARAALAMQMWYPAVLVAAVAFDRAVAETAKRIGMQYHAPNLYNILRNFAATERLTPDEIETLQTLRKFRNGIVHPRTKQPVPSYEEAREIVEAFEKGANILREVTAQKNRSVRDPDDIAVVH